MSKLTRVAESATGTGTGNITLAGRLTGHRAFADVYDDSEAVAGPVLIQHDPSADGYEDRADEWEITRATFDGGEIVRGDLLDSPTGERIDFSAGAKVVLVVTDRRDLAPIADLEAHVEATNNPHATTLEKARTAGNVLEGPVDLSDIAEQDPPSGAIRIYGRERRGASSLVLLNGAGIEIDAATDLVTKARNTTGATIPKGSAVYLAGSQGNSPIVGLAQANDFETMPCIGLAAHDVPNNEWGIFDVIGLEEDIDTSAWAEGSRLFVSPDTPGGLTTTRPTHPNFAQPVGVVENQHANQGSISVNIPPHLSGRESGTVHDLYRVGSGAGSGQAVELVGDQVQRIEAGAITEARTLTTPDASGVLETTAGAQAKVDAHEARDDNPHSVTAAQAGADPAGTASLVVSTHSAETESVHGIADTAALETEAGAASKVEGHRLTAVHTVAQPPAAHDNFAHTEAFETETGAQAKVDARVPDPSAEPDGRVMETDGGGLVYVPGIGAHDADPEAHAAHLGGPISGGIELLGQGLITSDRLIAYDGFNRPNRDLHGDTMPSGQTWSVVNLDDGSVGDRVEIVGRKVHVTGGGIDVPRAVLHPNPFGTCYIEAWQVLRSGGPRTTGLFAAWADWENWIGVFIAEEASLQCRVVMRSEGVDSVVATFSAGLPFGASRGWVGKVVAAIDPTSPTRALRVALGGAEDGVRLNDITAAEAIISASTHAGFRPNASNGYYEYYLCHRNS